ncbi:MAG: DUF1343 domain-containing protein [Enterobacterales bacterium]|nr:DUF1343 domain-containing protein [Enterobacterales bacterium]
MIRLIPKWIFLAVFLVSLGVKPSHARQITTAQKMVAANPVSHDLLVGAEQFDRYIPMLKGKRVGLLVNQTSRAFDQHLVDALLDKGVQISTIFAPEHGFRGDKAAGEKFDKEFDAKTGLPIYSLYASHKRPDQQQLKNVDILIFDIQDVGVRFYTFISSMHYLMQSCAEFSVPLIVLDRPNPNGDYVDGPLLDTRFSSFLGIHPIPMVHGLTVGELANMIEGESWLQLKFKALSNQVSDAVSKTHKVSDLHCDLRVIPVKNYRHDRRYSLPIKPSTNLPNDLSVRLYPSLALFEATDVSVGRGTPWPFQVLGYPDSKMGDFSFVPNAIGGSWKSLNHAETETLWRKNSACTS